MSFSSFVLKKFVGNRWNDDDDNEEEDEDEDDDVDDVLKSTEGSIE
jgi:hypothetical protein